MNVRLMMQSVVLVISLALSVEASDRRHFVAQAPAHLSPNSEGPRQPQPSGVAPSPAGPSTQCVLVKFDVENMNYLDMTKKHKDPLDGKSADSGSKRTKPSGDDAARKKLSKSSEGESKLIPAKTTQRPSAQDPVQGLLNSMDGASSKQEGQSKGTSFMQQPHYCATGGCTVGERLGEAVEQGIEEALVDTHEWAGRRFQAEYMDEGISMSPAPATHHASEPLTKPLGPIAPPGIIVSGAALSKARTRLIPAVAKLQWASRPGPAPVPVPAPGPAPGMPPFLPKPRVHVALEPGRKIRYPLLNQHTRHRNGHVTQTRATVCERPNNGQDDTQQSHFYLEHAHANGHLKSVLETCIHDATGIWPKIRDLIVEHTLVQQYDFNTCGQHMTSLVKSFAQHYTRRQVPMALLNSCTIFASRMSFSHDYVLDPQDTLKCRSATKKFARLWTFGKNADPKDFKEMCSHFCEAKYGDKAPQCQILM